MPVAPRLPTHPACRIPLGSLLLVSCLLLCGCGPANTGDSMAMATDDLGRQVHVPVSTNRVVALAPSLTEILYAAGAGAKVVGITTADDYPPEVASLPRFSALPVDFEAIVALEPDLVLASDQVNSTQDATSLAAVGLPVYFVGIRTLDDMLLSIRTVGQLLGTGSEANRVADSLGASLAALAALTSTVAFRPRTLVLVGDATLYGFGKGSYMHSMIALAGGESITASHDMTGPILTDEYVLMHRPEVIIGAFGPGYEPEAILEHHATWDIVPAVQEERVYSVRGDYFLRPGPRLVAGAWQMAALLHPGLVSSP